jgi:D-arabinan exo alpha-(1,3)/(1,5)-arabinofuranosidase (non-reducing end)
MTMRTRRIGLAPQAAGWLLAACAALGSARAVAEDLDLIKLVGQLSDLDRLPYLEEGVTSRQFSSYDRASRLGPNGEKIDWGANGDAGHYIRAEPGGEAVMAEMDGPGAITQTWSANPQGKLHIYIDGAERPIVFDFAAFTGGTIPEIPPPISSKDGAGFNCYLPIPYAKRCVIKADKAHGQYYHFDYLTFPAGTKVKSFAWPPGTEEKEAIARAAKRWADRCGEDPAGPGPEAKTAPFEVTLAPGATMTLLELRGPAIITAFRSKLVSGGKSARREVVLRAYWDGAEKPSVDAPWGDFFASTWADIPFKSLPIGMTERGGYSYFRMPFARSARLEAVNTGGEEARLSGEAVHAPAPWTERASYFHAKWRREAPNRTFDWPFLKCEGRGRFVGVAMSVQNPDPPWFGEGDEKVRVDGEAFPSWFGTGTEDYFCDAWGFRPFIRPVHGCPMYTEPGRTTVYRWHITDSIPFTRSFEMTIENYGNDKDYSSVAYWYADPPARDFFAPVVAEDRRLWPLSIPGALEAEALAHDAANVVSDARLPFDLSGGKGLRIASGGEERLEIPVPRKDAYRVVLFGPRGQKSPGLRATIGDDVVLEAPDAPFGETGRLAAHRRVVLEKGRSEMKIRALGGSAGEAVILDAVLIDPSPRTAGVLEAEDQKVTLSDDASEKVAYDSELEGLSGGAFLEVDAPRPGEWATLRLAEKSAGRFVLSLRLVQIPAGGEFTVQVNGKDLATPLIGYAARETLASEMSMGTVDLAGGDANQVHLVARGKPAGSSGLRLAIDYLRLKKILYPGVLEAESLKILEQDRANAQVQMLGDRFSAEGQLFCPGERNESVVLQLKVMEGGRYEVAIYFTRAADYGIVEVELDGKRIGQPFNGYHEGVTPSGKVSFGEIDLSAGDHRLTFRSGEKDPRSSNYFMGIDCIGLERR